MKIQDTLFLVVLILLIFKRDSKLALIFGLASIILSIPLFYLQIFFTAQHLIYYAFAFIILSVILLIYKEKLI